MQRTISRFMSGAVLTATTLGCGASTPSSNTPADASGSEVGQSSSPEMSDASTISTMGSDADDSIPVDSSSSTSPTSPESGVALGADGATAVSGLHVVGNHLVDGSKTVRLLGVNVSGTEDTCDQGTGIFQTPNDSSLVTPMKAWGINTIRVPLNEDCWLGINGIKSQYGGSTYQKAIESFVSMLRTNGMYVVVDLHINAPGTTLANSQQPMADADHSITFWTGVAQAFKADVGVVFDLYNEPNIDGGNVTTTSWDCWLNGCSVSNWTGFSGSAKTAGMQQMLDAIRSAGASNVVLVNGLGVGEFLGNQWISHEPNDPLGNVMAGHHDYSFNGGCNTMSCWQSTLAPVAAKVPLLVGELGEDDCAHGYVDSFFAFADPLGISYLGWTWNPWDCGSGPALISDYQGTATGFGQGFKTHLPTQK